MLFVTLIVVYILVSLVLVIGILINGVRPAKTLAWLLAIFTIPVGGILFYLLLGRNRRKNKLFPLQNDFLKEINFDDTPPEDSRLDIEGKTTELIKRTSDYPLTQRNRVTILNNGQETFESIFSALEMATGHIHIQYYIFEEGQLASRLLEVFRTKVQEGVEVRLLYDGIGSYSLSKSYIRALKNTGVEVHQFLPFRFGRFLSSLNYRNHRKIIIVDGEIGFTGGINISDKYLRGEDVEGNWRDTHLRIDGEAAFLLDTVFAVDWYLASGNKVIIKKQPKDIQVSSGNNLVQIVPSGPDDDFATMEQVYLSIINNAKQSVFIYNPYIIPNYAMLQSLKTAALSGLDVRLIMSESTDIKLVDWCVRAYFESYLKAGIKLYLYPKGFMHSKVVIIDDNLVSVGTANLDDRSLHQNYEVNALVYDKRICQQMKEQFLVDCEKSIRLNYEEYKQRGWPTRILEGTAKLMSPLL
ncbi:cardiolipin synthase [Flagellimonas meridianipacifica]|uniref:Cardiolipin synthase n=1 Tax=Flagellimonas meridianipacifica TaxID=1080225 RepID=A0A2T0MI16_9FLAO|nr:cardiolipin synthase [Allomuricauda pacifica]PRX57223.1 cardiolipin synthase [Allomuricauda pacifica]